MVDVKLKQMVLDSFQTNYLHIEKYLYHFTAFLYLLMRRDKHKI